MDSKEVSRVREPLTLFMVALAVLMDGSWVLMVVGFIILGFLDNVLVRSGEHVLECTMLTVDAGAMKLVGVKSIHPEVFM